jgi:uncharacterized protein YkwD
MPVWGILLWAATLAGAEREVLAEVNAHRQAVGLAGLAWSERAAEEARAHCGRVLAGTAAGPHDGFAARAERLRRATGARRAAENVFLMENGPFRAQRAMEAWLGSSSHRNTIEGPYELTGVGVVKRGARACAAEIFLGK